MGYLKLFKSHVFSHKCVKITFNSCFQKNRLCAASIYAEISTFVKNWFRFAIDLNDGRKEAKSAKIAAIKCY